MRKSALFIVSALALAMMVVASYLAIDNFVLRTSLEEKQKKILRLETDINNGAETFVERRYGRGLVCSNSHR